MKIKVLYIALTLGLLFSSLPIEAHSGGHPIRYVSANGKDNGVCNKASTPCKTIVCSESIFKGR